MSIYTSFDMIADCKAGKAEGWIFLARNFVPPVRWLYRHYGLSEPPVPQLQKSIVELPPLNEREIVARLRPEVTGGKTEADLDLFAEALADLTIVERQLVWLDAMQYEAPDAARHLRLSVETAQKARAKASEMLRLKLDSWTNTFVRDNGPHLCQQARAAKPAETIPFADYVEIIDGRMTWKNRVPIENALTASWYEIDQFCRVREADAAVSETKPLNDDELAPYLDAMKVARPKQPLLKRLFARK